MKAFLVDNDSVNIEKSLGEIPRIGPNDIQAKFDELLIAHNDQLGSMGVKMPKLLHRGLYTTRGLALIALLIRFQEPATKDELTNFVRKYRDGAQDVQDGRHLGRQMGWHVLSKDRGDAGTETWPTSSYSLLSLSTTLPGWMPHRGGSVSEEIWNEIVTSFQRRCSLCGSKEGEANLRSPNVITQLQQGHRDPSKDLSASNCIPQCQECNQPLGNKFIFDNRGRPQGIYDPFVIEKSPKEVQEQVWRILRFKFESDDSLN